jgi:acyl-CoA synthetase (AMP-forming)/AMP-acid ligase II
MVANLADLLAGVAGVLPDRTAVVCDGRRQTYRELTERSNMVAQYLVRIGIEPEATVGLYLPNCLEYVEAMLGCFVARALPVNINYRYTVPELVHIFGNAGMTALVVDAEYAERAAAVVACVAGIEHVLIVGSPGIPGPAHDVVWPESVTVLDYAEAIAVMPSLRPETGRSGDDQLLIYTGGTTGLPKGVLWRHEDFFYSALKGGNHFGDPMHSVAEVVTAAAGSGEMGYLLCAPLMHGAGTYTMYTAFLLGATVVMMRRFDAAESLALIDAEQVVSVAVVGDAMVRPLVDEMSANPGKYDLSTWLVLGSGGALFSDSVRDQLLALKPGMLVMNRFGASETGSDGQFEIGSDGLPRLVGASNVLVVDDELKPVAPGQSGHLAKSGHVPLGYYGDLAATAATFPVVDGVRWAVMGDLARLAEDGSIVVLGRGATCINTGGEKVFPEEVEQALKAHPAVLDAVVAGIADERFGERVAAVVQLRPGFGEVDEDELREHCRAAVAGYKVPTRVEFVGELVRSPTGKADYRWAREVLASVVTA